MPPGTDNYLAEWERGAKQEAAQLGYEIKIVENKFDQSEEDVQVQQQLASGDKPGAYVWWPVDNAAGVASLRKLGQSGVPVIAANQLPLPGTESFWAAYSGVDDVLNGQTSGKMMIELRDKLKAKGMQFHSSGGNVMIVFFPQGYSAGTDRIKGFQAATSGSGITIIDQQPAGFDATKGFQVSSQMISADKSKGIDLVYDTNDALADGSIQALQQAGYHPGVDVGVIGGTCHGKLDNLASGAEFATGLQAAFLEGIYVVITANRYLTGGGKVTAGKDYAPNDPANIPSATGPVFKYNFIPNPAVHSNEIDSTRLWGYTMKQLCTY
jgi:ribose transport system substrate-binding protein